jgi:hypothetical protein
MVVRKSHVGAKKHIRVRAALQHHDNVGTIAHMCIHAAESCSIEILHDRTVHKTAEYPCAQACMYASIHFCSFPGARIQVHAVPTRALF